MRALLHCQPLTGLGHFVRSREIARVLAERHEVWFATGARRFPGDRDVAGVRFVGLAPLERRDGRLAAVDPGRPLDKAVEHRARALREAVRAIRPDVLLVEHFPFGKPELRGEAVGLVEDAREAHPAVKVLCSLRDIALRGRYEAAAGLATDDAHGAAVCADLAAHFDALLVHGDPTVTRLEDQLPWASRIPVPVAYTGYVARRPGPPPAGAAGAVVVSAGGGAEADGLVGPCREAWRLLGGAGGLVVFPGPFAGGPAGAFADDLPAWLAAARLSVSRAGYNTCADVLAARARALLVPSPRMSDQRLRARRFAEMGLAATLAPEDATPEALAAAVRAALERPRPDPAVRLDGAARTREALEELAAGRTWPGL